MSERIVVGIDPGKQGAIAVRRSSSASVSATPLVTSPKGRDEYDVSRLARTLASIGATPSGDILILVERQQTLPPKLGGGLANYGRGYALGMVEGILAALGMPYELVMPRRWQALMLDGAAVPGEDTKQRSVIAAQRLFPQVSLLRTERSRKPDHGFADALLIAEYGWRRLTRAAGALMLVTLLASCASAPKAKPAGPCATTACGDVCCNGDGKVCPPCWKDTGWDSKGGR